MAKNRESYFWTSYSDLMTSLFFIMLTLFILTVVLLNQRMKATVNELEQIKAIQESIKELEQKNGYFECVRREARLVILWLNGVGKNHQMT